MKSKHPILIRIGVYGLSAAFAVAAKTPAIYKRVEDNVSGKSERPTFEQLYHDQTAEIDLGMQKLSATYRRDVDEGLRKLLTTSGYSFFATAGWCGPCRSLEKLMEEDSNLRKFDKRIVLNDATERSIAEQAYLIQRFAEKGISIPAGVPLMVTNENGRIRQYLGFNDTNKTTYFYNHPVSVYRVLEKREKKN